MSRLNDMVPQEQNYGTKDVQMRDLSRNFVKKQRSTLQKEF